MKKTGKMRKKEKNFEKVSTKKSDLELSLRELKIILVQKYVNHKKSTILVQSSSNLVKMISSWVERIAKI